MIDPVLTTGLDADLFALINDGTPVDELTLLWLIQLVRVMVAAFPPILLRQETR